MLHLFEKMNFRIERLMSEGVYELKMFFSWAVFFLLIYWGNFWCWR
jgi:hypothetical protein